MSYETENHLPKGVSIRQAAGFARLLGYKPNGTYAHLGSPKMLSLVHFEHRDYQSWNPIELSISENNGAVTVGTRSRIGRSHYDFEKQNDTVREIRKRFGGTVFKDGGNGSGYSAGPALPAAASGCYLAHQRLAGNLSRLNVYLLVSPPLDVHESMVAAQRIWPQMREYQPEIFSRNVLIPYIVATMEDFLKSLYVALLRYADNKAVIFKGARLSGEQLAFISDGKISVEEALSQYMSFQNIKLVGKHFKELDSKLDIIGPLRRPLRANVSLLDHMEKIVEQRHALIHGMELDIRLDTKKVQMIVKHVTNAMDIIYEEINRHFSWKNALEAVNAEV
jgi:hypothetical protein